MGENAAACWAQRAPKKEATKAIFMVVLPMARCEMSEESEMRDERMTAGKVTKMLVTNSEH